MSTALVEQPRTAPDAAEVDRDALEVYCPDAQTWSRTRDLFCESCGATNHELR